MLSYGFQKNKEVNSYQGLVFQISYLGHFTGFKLIFGKGHNDHTVMALLQNN